MLTSSVSFKVFIHPIVNVGIILAAAKPPQETLLLPGLIFTPLRHIAGLFT